MCDQSCSSATPGCSSHGLAPRVPAANHDDTVAQHPANQIGSCKRVAKRALSFLKFARFLRAAPSLTGCRLGDMEEVDSIILQNLRAIGTNIPDDVARLKGWFRVDCGEMAARSLLEL